MSGWVDWSKTTQSRNYRGSTSFATFMIIGPRENTNNPFHSDLLLPRHPLRLFPLRLPLLWTSAPVPDTFFQHLETHLKFMHQSPPLIGRLLNIIVFTGFLGFFIKLFRPSEANVLFDGASLVLYLIGPALRFRGHLDDPEFTGEVKDPRVEGEIILGKEDSLKVLAASNTILALVLVGVLVLQAGQWYAERKDREDIVKLEEEKSSKGSASHKKKQ
ncbi:ER membrane protein SH3 [Colletotrichum tofieldiae]|nr:ER membrane protein SH3 [Colletotrichum tofieldiae]